MAKKPETETSETVEKIDIAGAVKALNDVITSVEKLEPHERDQEMLRALRLDLSEAFSRVNKFVTA